MKIKGIDISFYQKNIDFKKVKNDGIIFAILREGYRKAIDSKFL
jgi:GH25 family lysozyme M1 (1,4-beta-N-acetylmuramidase)